MRRPLRPFVGPVSHKNFHGWLDQGAGSGQWTLSEHAVGLGREVPRHGVALAGFLDGLEVSPFVRAGHNARQSEDCHIYAFIIKWLSELLLIHRSILS